MLLDGVVVAGMAVVESCSFVAGAGAVVTVSAVQAFAALMKVGAAAAAVAETVRDLRARSSGIWDGEAVDEMVSECLAKCAPLRRIFNQGGIRKQGNEVCRLIDANGKNKVKDVET